MPQHEQHIDLVTLEDVERLLHETKFATIDDLVGRGRVQPLTTALASAAPRSGADAPGGDGLDPLPRRR